MADCPSRLHNVVMDLQNGVAGRLISAGSAPALPADLAKLRDRYLSEFPDAEAGASLLAYVPAALRHLLSLRLELHRAETLPARYREVAIAAWHNRPTGGDAVDHLVARYTHLVRDSRGTAVSAVGRELRRYFTEAQVVELALLLSMSLALDTFEAALTET